MTRHLLAAAFYAERVRLTRYRMRKVDVRNIIRARQLVIEVGASDELAVFVINRIFGDDRPMP